MNIYRFIFIFSCLIFSPHLSSKDIVPGYQGKRLFVTAGTSIQPFSNLFHPRGILSSSQLNTSYLDLNLRGVAELNFVASNRVVLGFRGSFGRDKTKLVYYYQDGINQNGQPNIVRGTPTVISQLHSYGFQYRSYRHKRMDRQFSLAPLGKFFQLGFELAYVHITDPSTQLYGVKSLSKIRSDVISMGWGKGRIVAKKFLLETSYQIGMPFRAYGELIFEPGGQYVHTAAYQEVLSHFMIECKIAIGFLI